MSIDWTKPIEMWDGRPARVLCTDFAAQDAHPVIVAETHRDGFELIRVFTLNGAPLPGLCGVRNKPVKREGWINVYPMRRVSNVGEVARSGMIYETREAAAAGGHSDVTACIRVEWEEAP